MGKKEDLTGQRFGRLTVLRESEERRHGSVCWVCRCDCGNVTEVSSSHLKKGHTKSCGCHKREAVSTHKMSKTRLYNTWGHIVGRCENPKDARWNYYGGRGVKVCAEWRKSFEAFYDWALANGYSDELTIDRIDVNGDYEPSNCRWATKREQARNRRTNAILTYNGESHCITEWADLLKVPRQRLSNRYHRGWTTKEILFGKP